ncbi:MAG TPA: hypothetical protein VEB19_01505 [Gemmatimonadaceae bacterium]|nr:hypothetical protein [Gemmatimonadaceae bacterium]
MPATTVNVRAYSHAIAHVTDNILRSFKDIVARSGMNPAKLVGDWEVLERGIRKWMETGHLEKVTLEIFNPITDAPLGFWDVSISYGYTGGDGEFWIDADAIRYSIQKAGAHPWTTGYRVIVTNKEGRPDVQGWSPTTGRSRSGFAEQRIGTAIDASGLSGGISYFRKV